MFTGYSQRNLDNIIFIDIDDTLADTRRAVYDLYVEATGDRSGDIKVKSKRYTDFCPLWEDSNVSALFEDANLIYSKTKPMAGAKEAINYLLAKGYDIRIATIHVASGVPAKQKWIDENFPTLAEKVYYINNISSNKDVFNGLALIDDDAKNIDTNKSKKPILLDVYGVYENRKGQECYASSWREVVDKLK